LDATNFVLKTMILQKEKCNLFGALKTPLRTSFVETVALHASSF
jgi:hypothetical protein